MVGNILTFSGDPPSALEAPDVKKVIDLFRQQNEILRAALTTCVIVPASTRISSIRTPPTTEEPNEN